MLRTSRGCASRSRWVALWQWAHWALRREAFAAGHQPTRASPTHCFPLREGRIPLSAGPHGELSVRYRARDSVRKDFWGRSERGERRLCLPAKRWVYLDLQDSREIPPLITLPPLPRFGLSLHPSPVLQLV